MTPKHQVLLYNPYADFFTQPLGLLAVASTLPKDTFQAVIWDGRLMNEPVASALKKQPAPLCIGVSVLSGPPIADALTFSRAAKKQYPNVPIVWGGWHPSILAEQCLAEPSVDAVVVGQGQKTFLEICESLAQGRSIVNIPGTFVKLKNGSIASGPQRELISLGELPPFDYGMIDLEKYFVRSGKRVLDYISSQGCPFRCAFCADPQVYRRTWLSLDAESTIAHLTTLVDRYQLDEVAFQDDLFFVERPRAMAIAQGLRDIGRPLTWVATARAQHISVMSEPNMQLLKSSGLRRVVIGAESGSDLALRKLQKDQRADMITKAVAKLARYGIDATLGFIVGAPGETEEERQETVSVIYAVKKLHPVAETPVFMFAPYPGSELVNQMQSDPLAAALLPKTLDEWSRCDLFSSRVSSMNQRQQRWYRRLDFYLRHLGAPRGDRFIHHALQRSATLRCELGRMDIPVEMWASQTIQKTQKWLRMAKSVRPLSSL